MSSCLSIVAALIVPLAAQAQSGEDVELARALVRKGWFDVASEILDKISKGGAPAAQKAMVPYVMAEIQLEKADRESDVEKSKQGMSEAVGQLRKFLDGNPNHPLAQEARVTIGWVQARMGRLLVDAMSAAETADKRDEYQKGALKSYSEAETFYQQTIADLKANIEKIKDLKDPAREKFQDSLMDARLELPRVMVEHARISGMDETTRKKLLKDAQAQLVDFEFDFGDRPIAFEAMLEEGKCLTDIGDFKQAESRLKATLSLRQSLAAAKIKPNGYHLKIINGAHIALAQMFIKGNKLNEARQYVDTVLKEDRSLEKDPDGAGYALKLEKADALFRLKDSSGAGAIANEIIKQDPNGKWGYLAGLKIKSWGSMAGSAGLRMPPDQLLKAAEAAFQKGQDREALVNLRKCIEGCVTETEKKEFQVNAYFKMGVIYQDLRRNYEAAIAYEQVLTLFPDHPLAAKACYEAGRCYSLEFEVSKDKKDDELKEKFLSILATKWPKDPVARNIRYMQAEKVEKAGDLKKAADLYLQVGEDAEAYENALVAAGYCLHIDATKKWEKGSKDPAVQTEVKNSLRLAEEALRKFLARLADPSKAPSQENLIKARENLKLVANQELAYILMHEAVGKTEDALSFLEQVAKTIPPEDERIAKIWSTQIQAYLAQKKVEQAIKVLDMMLDKFPDAPALARACKSVAIKLDEATATLETSNGDAATINNNLKKISRYYATWLRLAPALGMRITMQDVISVAETLYRIAKQLNGLDKDVVSFMDLKEGKAIAERQYFSDAAMVLTLLVDGKVSGTKLPDKEKILLMTRLARCESFLASDASSWEKANQAYEGIIKSYKVVDNRGLIDINVVSAHKELLGVYSEQGYVYYELGKRGQKFQLDNATTVFSNLLRVLPQGSQDWWQAKYMVFTVLFERGKESDLRDAKAGISNLELNFPDFDGGKFGMKDKLKELKAKIQQVSGGK
jgi:tetratricopeptide (TPR) repeat protein